MREGAISAYMWPRAGHPFR